MKYGFLIRYSMFPKPCMVQFLNNASFVESLDEIFSHKHHITDDDVYEIIKRLYYPKWCIQDKSDESGMMRKALFKYDRAKFGDPSVWENEFIALSESGATEYEEP